VYETSDRCARNAETALKNENEETPVPAETRRKSKKRTGSAPRAGKDDCKGKQTNNALVVLDHLGA
jgi:hypothetical protein